MAEPSFEVTKPEAETIEKIAARAMKMDLFAEAPGKWSKLDVIMDITATHANGCPLRLEGLLEADDFNFIHDVGGIYRHLDRETGQLGNCFDPRSSQPAA